jgi:hypothetical protein
MQAGKRKPGGWGRLPDQSLQPSQGERDQLIAVRDLCEIAGLCLLACGFRYWVFAFLSTVTPGPGRSIAYAGRGLEFSRYFTAYAAKTKLAKKLCKKNSADVVWKLFSGEE